MVNYLSLIRASNWDILMVFVNVLGSIDGITIGIDVETYLGSLDGSFDIYNDGNLVG